MMAAGGLKKSGSSTSTEACDNLDTDCNGALDFPGEDVDGDGYGACLGVAAPNERRTARPAMHRSVRADRYGMFADIAGAQSPGRATLTRSAWASCALTNNLLRSANAI